MNKLKAEQFRIEFNKLKSTLEEKFNINVSIGTIRFDSDGLTTKITAKNKIDASKIEKINPNTINSKDLIGRYFKFHSDDSRIFQVIKELSNDEVSIESIRGKSKYIQLGKFKVSKDRLLNSNEFYEVDMFGRKK